MGAVRVSDREMAALNRALRTAANRKELQKQLRKELRVEARKMVPPLRKAIKSLPSKGARTRLRIQGVTFDKNRRRLRQLMASSVAVQVKTGNKAAVAVFMNPRRMPFGMRSLPGYFERVPGKERLRHPVFGNRNVWVQNQSVPPQGYFTRTVEPMEDDAVDAIRQIVDRITRAIEEE